MISEAKVKYILGLLGRKRSSVTVPSLTATSPTEDSQFTDIDSNSDSDTSLLYEEIPSPTRIKEVLIKMIKLSSFNPTLPVIADDYSSNTTELQGSTEIQILQEYQNVGHLSFRSRVHLHYILSSFERKLPSGYAVLEATHPWMVFWLLNAYNLIVDKLNDKPAVELINEKIKTCIVNKGLGGIAGGKNQVGHVAATYAAVLTMVSTKNYSLLKEIKDNLYTWFVLLKREDGSFEMHRNGESDTRSTYCVLVVSSLLNILSPELTQGVEKWLNKSQTYEGGFAGVAETEAHGGYSFCAFACYFLLYTDKSQFSGINLNALIRWSVLRQSQVEGSLSGRTNKLVDACYSFWIGGLFPLIEVVTTGKSIFDRDGLYNYILRCAQAETGGFRDKPGKLVDFYHTNYTLCGLSICERMYDVTLKPNGKELTLAYRFQERESENDAKHTHPVHPVFGIPINLVQLCYDEFYED